ncbi:MAG: hypothetical protein ACLP8S_15845 [Solirubrobacteraceae bacterium]
MSGVADALGGHLQQPLDTSRRSLRGAMLGQARKRKKEREYGDPDGGGYGAQERVARAGKDAEEEREPGERQRDHVHGARDQKQDRGALGDRSWLRPAIDQQPRADRHVRQRVPHTV